jgi:hypothetical protein
MSPETDEMLRACDILIKIENGAGASIKTSRFARLLLNRVFLFEAQGAENAFLRLCEDILKETRKTDDDEGEDEDDVAPSRSDRRYFDDDYDNDYSY